MTETSNWARIEVAGGRYLVVDRIGVGSMGHIYLARDRNLGTDVVIKRPVVADWTLDGPEALERFGLEIRSLVDLSHPHIVRIIDVGAHEGSPYVVMQYLAGGSLKDRMEADVRQGPRPVPPATLREWLLEVAKALDFIHGQNYLHRDVKPANILFDRYGNAFLSDFGIVKALSSEAELRRASQLTTPGLLLGTPNYVAPEVVMGLPGDGRVDQYALALTVHEVLSGSNCMEGPSPTATLVNQTNMQPPPLSALVPGIPRGLSDAVARALSKDPDDRFEDCVSFAEEVLAGLPTGKVYSAVAGVAGESSARGGAANVPCPSCQNALVLGEQHVGERVLCSRCQAVVLVQYTKNETMRLNLVSPPPTTWADQGRGSGSGRYPSSRSPSPSGTGGSRATNPRPDRSGPPPRASTRRTGSFDDRGGPWPSPRRWLAYAAVTLGLLAAVLVIRRELLDDGRVHSRRLAAKVPLGGGPPDPGDEPSEDGLIPAEKLVSINIAYGTEKKAWLNEAIAEFKKTEAGKRIKINPLGMGSLEGEKACLKGPVGEGSQPIHVWSPASSAVRDLFETEWRKQRGGEPILRAENLALTPMVFVIWKDRYEAFLKRYQRLDFETIAEAMHEPGGWASIANKPDWGIFKFSHTDPRSSNSGLLTLVMMAYAFNHKERGLTPADVADPKFQAWLHKFEDGVRRQGGKLNHSTGTLMEEMVSKGPSQYDCVIVYENLAVDLMKTALERWRERGQLYVVYPDPNMWNEHPYYVLNAPWSDPAQREAANEFLDFLLSAPVQQKALEHGFRPGNMSIPVRSPNSPLVRNERFGVKFDILSVCDPPSAAVITELLQGVEKPAGP